MVTRTEDSDILTEIWRLAKIAIGQGIVLHVFVGAEDGSMKPMLLTPSHGDPKKSTLSDDYKDMYAFHRFLDTHTEHRKGAYIRTDTLDIVYRRYIGTSTPLKGKFKKWIEEYANQRNLNIRRKQLARNKSALTCWEDLHCDLEYNERMRGSLSELPSLPSIHVSQSIPVAMTHYPMQIYTQ